jgi:hypothetical protein
VQQARLARAHTGMPRRTDRTRAAAQPRTSASASQQRPSPRRYTPGRRRDGRGAAHGREGDILEQHRVCPSCDCARLPIVACTRRSVVRAAAMDRLHLKEVVHGVAL